MEMVSEIIQMCIPHKIIQMNIDEDGVPYAFGCDDSDGTNMRYTNDPECDGFYLVQKIRMS